MEAQESGWPRTRMRAACELSVKVASVLQIDLTVSREGATPALVLHPAKAHGEARPQENAPRVIAKIVGRNLTTLARGLATRPKSLI